MEIVEFKSIPEYYNKEKSGKKPNTERFCHDDDDLRFSSLKSGEAKIIRIKNAITGETFERVIEDVTVWNDLYIISWRHPTWL